MTGGFRENLAFIFARGGSKGLPRKNVRELAGKPLLGHAIEQALESSFVDEVYLSTDDEEIAQAGRKWGAKIPFDRPDRLARDETPEIEAWRHAIETMRERGREFRRFVTTPVTSPFRLPRDIDNAIECFVRTDADLVVCVSPSHRNPYYNMVELDNDGEARIVIRPEGGKLHRRQDAPEVFDLTTIVYVADPDYVLDSDHLYDGTVQTVQVPEARALDVDRPLDLEMARFLWKKLREEDEDEGVE